jgi:hypothetical protein
MIKFHDFVVEELNFPVITLDKEKVDLDKESTRNEINRNLSSELVTNFINPYAGWLKVGKVLTLYNITLPKVIFKNDIEGEEVVAITQFGADLSGKESAPQLPYEEEYYLYYSYEVVESGLYEAYAIIVNGDELENMLEADDEDDDDIDVLGFKSELDYKQ